MPSANGSPVQTALSPRIFGMPAAIASSAMTSAEVGIDLTLDALEAGSRA
jgi:hypothetical protein